MSFYNSTKIVVNILLIIVAIFVFAWFFREYKINKLNKRLNKFSIVTNNRRHSLFDDIVNFLYNFRLLIKKLLLKSNYFKKYAIKYEKYLSKDSRIMKDAMDFVATKIGISLLFVFTLLASSAFNRDSFTFTNVIIAFTLGYFVLDLFLIGRKKYVDHEIKNDLLKAITIMNNCFKSGKSIIQTIEIVKEELDGPLQKEFIKMHEDLSYGLELDLVFERFNKRVDLPEVKYITTSLKILDKTGGNVINVFDLIEKTVFTNKKLEDELHNLSAASKALYRMLIVIPLIFTLAIYILDPTYFMPLFGSPLGLIIVFLIIFLYIMYIIIIRKVSKIKEY